ncbi:MAG: Inositol 2-dehydrogenase/D-chiro-inositol 3-dehydrogenase [Chroococcopsis gigantea SAG 12.99]|jgi:predicted dehydrogenase|nr:Gfo/Idh/MocA family oxidoreductase [Chlorogloea purpurea SAG 13.99]MDV3000702.1 Inositol 2-dehydrogenase/D-chiro-inositol 3-dehydrogenase [Chroococcopsis gigantea SAG 12.99]
MKIAIIGCGYVASYYLKTLSIHPQLELVKIMDKDTERANKFSQYYSIPACNSLADILIDPKIEMVVNLTNPRSHHSISKACLEAGKNVYSEKPLAMTIEESKELVEIARQNGLQICSAPCSLLSETAQTIWKGLRENIVGDVYLVYAEMDDGLVHKMPYKQWVSEFGAPWPYKDEFEVGCTLEHAGYYVTWLTAFFGPAQTVTAFSSCLIPDKVKDESLSPADTPDFSVACIKFASGVVARLTCSIVGPHDHSLRIIGEDGILGIKDCWYYGDPIYIQRMVKIRRKVFYNPLKEKYPLVKKAPEFDYRGAQEMDFCRGVAEMASAITEKRPNRLSMDFSLHNNELALAIQSALETGSCYRLTTTFDPIEPMPWAK